MSSNKRRGRPANKKKFIEEEAEETVEYTNEELEGYEVDQEMEALEDEHAPKSKPVMTLTIGGKRPAEKQLQKATAKAAKVAPKPAAPAVKVPVPKPKPKPAPSMGKGKEKETEAPLHNRTKARGLVTWDYSGDRSVTNVDLDNYEDVLSRLYVNKRGSKGWNFEVGFYAQSTEEWVEMGGPLPREVKPIRFCFEKPHRMHFVPSRFGDGQWGGPKLPEAELKKKPYSVSADLNLDNEKDDFDRKLYQFYTDFQKAVGELIVKKIPIEEVRQFFELPVSDYCEYWYSNPFTDGNFFKGLISVNEDGRGHLKVKFPMSWSGENLYVLGDMSVPSAPRNLPSPDYIEADQGIAGTFEFGDIWIAKLKSTKPDPQTGICEEYFAAGQNANATIVWRFTQKQTEEICGPAPSGGQDSLKLEANKGFNIEECGFLKNFTLDK